MGIVAKRLTQWSIGSGILSPEQKSARPTEGCYEHTNVLKSPVGQARRTKKKLSLTWLDIGNALAVSLMLQFLLIVLYDNQKHWMVLLMPIQAGVKQGCPLNPILFNLSTELILCHVKEAASNLKMGQCDHYGTSIPCLAYA